MKILRRTCGCALLVSVGFAMLVLEPAASEATATMTIVNRDKANEGLNDSTPVAPVGGNTGTTLGEQRLIALQFAADTWGDNLNSAVPISIGAQFNALTCSSNGALLGQAGAAANAANFDAAPHRDTWYPIALANALSSQDLDPGDNNTDIEATFTSAIDNGSCSFPLRFYYGLDGHTPGNQVDFITTALHELGHGLGFFTLVNLGSGAKAKGFDDAFMRNLVDHSTGRSYPEMTNAERVDASQNTGNLVWTGAAVRAASGVLTSGTVGKDVRMYAPSPQQPGSSVSHWDTVLSPNESMEAIYSTTIHSPGLAKQAFEDMGWPIVGGNQGQLAITPSSFDFGDVDTGNASDEIFTVSNPGTSTIHVASTQTTGPDASEFEVLGGVNSFPLNPGATKNVTVRFTPAAPDGAKTATLRFTTSDAGGLKVDAQLRGTAIVLNPKINVTPTKLDFKTVTVGASADLSVTVKNTGTGTLLVSSAQVVGANANEFEVQGALSVSLAPDDTHDVTIRFTPVAPSGDRDASLDFASNDAKTPTKSVALKGESLVPVYDLAVTDITAPASVPNAGGTKPVKVVIQNRSNHDESIDAAHLNNGLVKLTVTRIDSDGENCANAVVALDAEKNDNYFSKGPKVLKPKNTLAINFLVTYQCAAPLTKSDSDSGDYSHSAKVFHSVLGKPDEHPQDDVCPHNALGTVPNPDGKLKDNGCGKKQSDGTFTAPETNVVP